MAADAPLAAIACVGLAALWGTAASPAAAQNARRALIVLVARPEDPRVAAQRAEIQALGRDGDDRDLSMIVVSGPSDDALGRRGDFETLLVGKDGGVKLRSRAVITARALATTIDAMPMRKEEMSRKDRRAGPP